MTTRGSIFGASHGLGRSIGPVAATGRRFKQVHLSEGRLDVFHSAAHTALSSAIQEFVKLDGSQLDPKRWRYIRSRGGSSAYFDRRRLNHHLSSVLVAGTMKANLGDVMEGLYMDNTEDTRMVLHLINNRFVDAEVLQVIQQRSPEHPSAFTGLKWAMLKSSTSGLMSNRDICYFEKLGTVDIADGRKLGYFIMQSVDLPECLPLSRVVRAHISLCYLFEELHNGQVGMFMIGSMGSRIPHFMKSMATGSLADIALSVGNAVDVAHAKRYARLKRSKLRFRKKEPSSIVCDVCRAVPSFFDHHQECAGCNKTTVCKKCRAKCDVFDREHESSNRLARAVFCIECITEVTTAPENDTPAVTKEMTKDLPEDPIEFHEEKPREPSVESYASSYATVTEDDGLNEEVPIGQQSLRRFSLLFRQELEDAGYNDTDSVLRMTGLTSLGAGDIRRFCSEDSEDDSEDEDEVDEEEILSIEPLRRSVQPPEMLAMQELDCEGRLRHQRTRTNSCSQVPNSQRALFSRLAEVSRAAEKTFQFAKEQTEIGQRVFERSRCKASST